MNAFLAFPLTYGYINILAWYYAVCDIGINAAANSLGLLFITAPIMLLLFLAATVSTSFMGLLIFRWHARKIFCFGFLSMILVFVAGFNWELWKLMDYPHMCFR
jgi:hypothetical protein